MKQIQLLLLALAALVGILSSSKNRKTYIVAGVIGTTVDGSGNRCYQAVAFDILNGKCKIESGATCSFYYLGTFLPATIPTTSNLIVPGTVITNAVYSKK
ncbi:MAG: hypothetical protein BGO55_23565 [Sphingobacteriales bacterium 50-39]|nr:hypothetical protein [Sphingobacteriales bacterium]OJW58280.1 MAG: hypothetical protein BGO55_23565 [Sphingobacteriales bacterium 50-39]